MFEKFKEFFTSKKWLATMGVILANIGGALSGNIEWSTALMAITAAIIAAVTGQALIDMKRQ